MYQMWFMCWKWHFGAKGYVFHARLWKSNHALKRYVSHLLHRFAFERWVLGDVLCRWGKEENVYSHKNPIWVSKESLEYKEELTWPFKILIQCWDVGLSLFSFEEKRGNWDTFLHLWPLPGGLPTSGERRRALLEKVFQRGKTPWPSAPFFAVSLVSLDTHTRTLSGKNG